MMIRGDLDHVVRRKTEDYLSRLWTSKEENREYAIAFLAGALMGVVSLAVKNEEFNDAARISTLLQEMIAGNYFQLPHQ